MVKLGGWIVGLLACCVATPAFADESDGVVVHRADNGPAVITVESEGKPVTVSQIVDRMAARGVSTTGQSVLLLGVTYRDLCVTPCTFEMKPGLAELAVHGDGVSGQTLKLDFQSGPQRLRVEPGSSGLAVGGGILLAAGLTTAVVGVVFLALSDDIMSFEALPLTLIGTGVTGLSIGMIVAANTSFEKVGNSRLPAQRGVATQTPQIGVRGAF